MTAALRLHHETPPVDLRDYVPIADAAKALGVSADHLSRQCRQQLQGAGHAILHPPPGGGKPQWFVARAYHHRLSGNNRMKPRDAEALDQYTGKQVRLAMMRAQCVDRFAARKTTRRGKVKDWLPTLIAELKRDFPDLPGVSKSALYKWAKRYDGPADLEQLIDDRGGNGHGKGDPAAWRFFTSLYLDERKFSLKRCWKLTKQEAMQHGWLWCSQPSCRRQLDDRIPLIQQVMHRDPKRYRNEFEPTIEQPRDRYPAGRCWTADHAQMDFWCKYGNREQLVRLFVTAWMDWTTRKIVGWHLAPVPNSATILAAFKMGMMDESNHGGPTDVIVDNGKDFDAWTWTGESKKERKRRVLSKGYIDEPHFKGTFGLLSIQPHFALPYNPRGKTYLERFFGKMHDRFDRNQVTYCGATPEDRPESLAQVLKDRRNVPTFAQVKEAFGDFVTGYNLGADHDIDGLIDREHGNVRLSPAQAMEQWTAERLTRADENVLTHTLQLFAPPVKVNKQGVRVTISGATLHYGQHDGELRSAAKRGRRFVVGYDPHDLAWVRVYEDHEASPNRRGRFVTSVPINLAAHLQLEGVKMTHEHVREMMQRKRRFNKDIQFRQQNRLMAIRSDEELLAATAAEMERPIEVVAKPLKIVRGPVDGSSSPDRNRQKKAAGAEHDNVPPGFPRIDLADLRGQFSEDPVDNSPPDFRAVGRMLNTHNFTVTDDDVDDSDVFQPFDPSSLE